MANIRLVFDGDRVTIGDLVAFEEGLDTAKEMRDMLLKFVVDEDGNTPGKKKATELINAMTVNEMVAAVAQLGEMAQDELVPPPQGDN